MKIFKNFGKYWYYFPLVVVVFYFSPIVMWCVGFDEPSLKYSDAINALFSGLAFAVLIISIKHQTTSIQQQSRNIKNQQTSIELQREEIQQTIQEQKLANDEFKAQNSNLALQRFENTFFSIVNNLHESLSRISNPNENIQNGEASMKFYISYIKNSLEYVVIAGPYNKLSIDDRKQMLKSEFVVLLNNYDIARDTNVYYNTLTALATFIMKQSATLNFDTDFYRNYTISQASPSFLDYLVYLYVLNPLDNKFTDYTLIQFLTLTEDVKELKTKLLLSD